MNFIKISMIILTMITIGQFIGCCDNQTNLYKNPNSMIYGKFAEYLHEQFPSREIYKYKQKAEAMSPENARKSELALNIAAIRFNRLSKTQKNNLHANSIQDLLSCIRNLSIPKSIQK